MAKKEWICKVVAILGICPSFGIGERKRRGKLGFKRWLSGTGDLWTAAEENWYWLGRADATSRERRPVSHWECQWGAVRWGPAEVELALPGAQRVSGECWDGTLGGQVGSDRHGEIPKWLENGTPLYSWVVKYGLSSPSWPSLFILSLLYF